MTVGGGEVTTGSGRPLRSGGGTGPDADSAPAAAAAARLARALLWPSAGLSDTDPSVCLSVSPRARGGPALPEAQPLPFGQVTRLRWGTFGTKPRKWGKGAGELARQAESRGGRVPLKGWAADRTTTEGRRRGRRARGGYP